MRRDHEAEQQHAEPLLALHLGEQHGGDAPGGARAAVEQCDEACLGEDQHLGPCGRGVRRGAAAASEHGLPEAAGMRQAHDLFGGILEGERDLRLRRDQHRPLAGDRGGDDHLASQQEEQVARRLASSEDDLAFQVGDWLDEREDLHLELRIERLREERQLAQRLLEHESRHLRPKRRRESLEQLDFVKRGPSSVEEGVVLLDTQGELTWQRAPRDVLLDSVRLLLHQRCLPVHGRDQRRDRAHHVAEDERRAEHGAEGVRALAVVGRCDVAVAHSGECRHRPVERIEIAYRQRRLLRRHLAIIVRARPRLHVRVRAATREQQVHAKPETAEDVREKEHANHHEDDAEQSQIEIELILKRLHVLVDLEQPQQPQQPEHAQHAQHRESSRLTLKKNVDELDWNRAGGVDPEPRARVSAGDLRA
mmetsp:Transcript_46325/g.121550  ORF Transcript_46325/g.121550 Transcript_46325/m.121550 type:complete len:422 (-) Transcript_46325:223-1488(-)